MTVGAVVVTHRTPHRALAAATSLRAAGADHVVVVDAGSGGEDVAVLRAAGEQVVALENVGFGRAANAGVAALPPTADVLVVCNADTVWRDGSVTLLAEAVGRDGVVAAGPTVLYPDGRRQASARRLPDVPTAVGHALLGLWWPANRWTRRYRMLDVDHTVAREVDWLSGCALAVDRAAFAAVGGFDPGYFLYVEDVDLGVRLRAAGGRLVTVPAAVVEHEVGASTRQLRSSTVRHHARSIDRFVTTHLLRGPWVVLRPLLRVALAGWVASALAWGRTARARGRSSTGE